MKGMVECIECGKYFKRKEPFDDCCDDCLPIRRLFLSAFRVPEETVKKVFGGDEHGFVNACCRVEGINPEIMKIRERLSDYYRKVHCEGRTLVWQLEWMYRHNKEELKENNGDPGCRFFHLTFSAFMYEKLMALLKKGFGEGALSLKSLGELLERSRDQIKIYAHDEWGEKKSGEVLLDLEPIYQAMRDCKDLYKWASSFLKKAGDYNQEFLDHRCYYHKGESDEASIFELDRVRSLIDAFCKTFCFLFGAKKDWRFYHFTEEQEDEYMEKIQSEYESRKRKEIRLIHFGDKVYEA